MLGHRLRLILRLLIFSLPLAPRFAVTAPAAPLETALTPVIGVDPEALHFGYLCPGICHDLEVALRNAGDLGSELAISNLVISPPFTLVDPPATPFSIPGDGTLVPITVRYCAAGSGSQNGVITISASNAPLSPVIIPINGIADPPPECDPGGPYVALPGQAITFDARGSNDPGGTIVSFIWDFGDGATAEGPVATHSYPLAGTYSVRLDLTDDCGGISTCLVPAFVFPNQPPVCVSNGPYAGLTATPLLMTGAGSFDPDGQISIYRWNFGDGQTANGITQSHVYYVPGLYNVSLTVIDLRGGTTTCSTTADIVEFNDPPVCDAGGPYEAILGQPITFDGSRSSDPDNAIVHYQWQFGDCATGTGATPTHTYTVTGVYGVSLCVSDSYGTTSCCTAELTIESRPSPAAKEPRSPGASRAYGANPLVTLPLHWAPECAGCIPSGVDCQANRPTVNIPANSTSTTIYLMANNHTALTGVQTAFEWHPDWLLLGAQFDCLPGQLTTAVPASPGGASAGTLNTTFDCVTNGGLLVIGRLLMMAGSSGCLWQVESSSPSGTHALDCYQSIDRFLESQQYYRLGRICVENGGVDACAPINAVVQPATWGQVKATYR